jgi:recombinational DNA repair protein (RecF pathway)
MITHVSDKCPACGKSIIIPHVSVLREGIICTPCSNVEIKTIEAVDVISDHDHCGPARPTNGK